MLLCVMVDDGVEVIDEMWVMDWKEVFDLEWKEVEVVR